MIQKKGIQCVQFSFPGELVFTRRRKKEYLASRLPCSIGYFLETVSKVRCFSYNYYYLQLRAEGRPEAEFLHSITRASRAHRLTTRASVRHTQSACIVRVTRDKQPLVTCPRSFYVWWRQDSNTVLCYYVPNNIPTHPQRLFLQKPNRLLNDILQKNQLSQDSTLISLLSNLSVSFLHCLTSNFYQ